VNRNCIGTQARRVPVKTLVVLVGGLLLHATEAWSRTPGRDAGQRCRRTIARSVRQLTNAGLASIAACWQRAGQGRQTRENCNQIPNTPGATRYGRTEALAKFRMLREGVCPPGSPALANYPGETVRVAVDVLLPAVKRSLEDGAGESLGAMGPNRAGGGNGRQVTKCRRAIARARQQLVRRMLRSMVECQLRLDQDSGVMLPLAPACVATADASMRQVAVAVGPACAGLSAAQVGGCRVLPDCVVQGAEALAARLARFAFPDKAECGNGVVELGEECDDGNDDFGDGCEPNCRETGAGQRGFCGDRIVEPPFEECDLGNNGNSDEGNCTTACKLATCGDGLVDKMEPGVEECDDGNAVAGDGCTECTKDGVVCLPEGIVANVALDYNLRVTGPLLGMFVDLGYPPGLSIPGSGTAASVRDRVTALVSEGVRFIPSDQDANGDAIDDRVRMLLSANSVDRPVAPGPVARIRFDCEPGREFRPSDLQCALDSVSDSAGGVLDPERLQAEGVRCLVESLEGGAPVTTTTTTTTTTTRRPTTSTSLTTTTTTTTTAIPVTCGNGVVDPREECDDGNANNEDDCLESCRFNRCGDGFVDRQGPLIEECDDGNRDDRDGCTNACTLCGNLTVTDPETCDDGNLVDEDFCPATCRIEFCQAGTVEVPVTVKLSTPDVSAVSIFLEYPEGKIDLPGIGGDIPSGVITGGGSMVIQGNDFEHAVRVVAFDAFNFGTPDLATIRFTRCAGAPYPSVEDFRCRIEGEATDENQQPVRDVECFVTLPPPENLCGDGVVDPGEECDDGNTVDADGCLTSCRRNVCGDGFVNPEAEQCDDGNRDAGDGCTNACTICGDRTVTEPETCDDGNLEETDFCPPDCQVDFCQEVVEDIVVTVTLSSPEVAALTLFVDYPEALVWLPGIGGDIPQGVIEGPGSAVTQGNDFDHALRVVIFDVFNFATTDTVRLRFGKCAGMGLPAAGDFRCRIEGDATDETGAVVPGVTCSVRVE